MNGSLNKKSKRLFNIDPIQIDHDKLNFVQHTNWVVITGAPSSGKTTVVNIFKAKGYNCIEETARAFIEQNLAAGKTLEEIRGNESEFQSKLLYSKLNKESNIDPNNITLFDRGVPDSLTYYRLSGLDPNQIVPNCLYNRYKVIFHFERLPLVKDNVRTEDEEEVRFIDHWLVQDYSALNYKVIKVPAVSVQKRVEFIIDQITPLLNIKTTANEP